jgi:hypothetical protein
MLLLHFTAANEVAKGYKASDIHVNLTGALRKRTPRVSIKQEGNYGLEEELECANEVERDLVIRFWIDELDRTWDLSGGAQPRNYRELGV